jgi:hypothetical protein
MKKLLLAGVMSFVMTGPTSAGIFSDDATTASRNLSKAADNFEVMRRVVFMNNVTNAYMLEIIGYCSIKVDTMQSQLEVTCMTDDDFKKHFLGLNDTTTYFIEQLQPSRVSRSHYRVTFKPQAIIPDVDFRWDTDDLTTNHSEANQ